MQTRFLRSQQDLKAKMLERQAQADDQAINPAGEKLKNENICCRCFVCVAVSLSKCVLVLNYFLVAIGTLKFLMGIFYIFK